MSVENYFFERMVVIIFNYRYEKYSQKNGWKFDVVQIMESDLKGYKVLFLFFSFGVVARVAESEQTGPFNARCPICLCPWIVMHVCMY